MRLLFATDLHGSTMCFKKFVAASRMYDAELLVLGGDLSAKALVPIRVRDSSAEFEIYGRSMSETGKGCVDRAVERVEQVGLYPLVLEPGTEVRTEAESMSLPSTFHDAIKSRLRDWATHAAHKLGSRGRIYTIPGNDDHPCIDTVLDESNVFVSVDRRVVEVGEGLVICGLGASNATPWNTFREMSEEAIADQLALLMAGVPTGAKCIWNVHVPPAGIGLDICDAPDVEGKKSWFANMSPRQVSAGSSSVAAAVRRYQPLLGLFGHVHEGRGAVKVGGTLCVNPGSEYFNSVLHAALIDIEDSSITAAQLISG